MSSQQNGLCVGSMGLHQNNLVHREDNSTHGSPSMSQSPPTTRNNSIWNINSRSVVDVFRGIRDRYFGKPELPKPCQKTPSREESIASVNADDDDGSVASLNSLPIYCKLMVLSFLETKDVCNISLASSHWHHVSNDQILWRELLIRDMCRWSSMTNKSHPLLPKIWNSDRVSKLGYGVDIADLIPYDDSACTTETEMCGISSSLENRRKEGVNYKALYIHSSYQRAQDDIDESHPASGLPSLLKSIWSSNDSSDQGEVIITGPGIDSPRTSKLFRSLMWGNEFLETKGLLPGNRDGIGSGVQVVFKGKTSFNLIALYSGNNRVRENRTGMERLRNSNMVELVHEAADRDDNVESDPVLTLHEAVRFYIAERKGNYKLIYTVDASVGQKWEDIVCNKLELDAILKGTVPDTINSALVGGDAADGGIRESNPDNSSESIGASNVNSKRPLLILSCVDDDAASRLSTLQIIAMLGLHDVTDRQWRVQDVVVSNMQGVEKGIDWLLRHP